jgi:hypothetical protein
LEAAVSPTIKPGLKLAAIGLREGAMVKCLTDFSCWETIAKIAPIGTALIALIAAMIALGAIWAQMHIARRRASIDFFLKTEIDKTVIDLYNKFKANAQSIAFVPDPLDLTRSDYEDIRAFLNICELIAVGVNKGAFSKSVSEAYWGDVIPNAYQTAKQLINNIRNTPGEGSRYTYVNLEKLAKRWAKRTRKATKLVDRR